MSLFIYEELMHIFCKLITSTVIIKCGLWVKIVILELISACVNLMFYKNSQELHEDGVDKSQKALQEQLKVISLQCINCW